MNEDLHYRNKMDLSIWVYIGSGNGLLSDGTKPLPEPMFTVYSLGSVALLPFSVRSLKIILLKLSPHIPGGMS